MQTPEQKLKYLNKTIDTLWHGTDTSTGDYPKIINLYKEVLKINPKDRDAWENMIWLYWSLSINNKDTGLLLEAEKFAKRYLSIMPNGYRAYEYLGIVYRSMVKDERLAIRYYESAVRWKDCPASTFNSLVALCIKNKDKIRARDYCILALKKYPKDNYSIMRLKEINQ